jgi:hypothetical protein
MCSYVTKLYDRIKKFIVNVVRRKSTNVENKDTIILEPSNKDIAPIPTDTDPTIESNAINTFEILDPNDTITERSDSLNSQSANQIVDITTLESQSNNVSNELDLKIIISNLETISKLREHQKLWLNDGGILTIDDSWFPGYTRWKNGQSKEILIPCIIETINTALILDNTQYPEIINLITSSLLGLKNLVATYPSKSDDIQQLIETINNKKLNL